VRRISPGSASDGVVDGLEEAGGFGDGVGDDADCFRRIEVQFFQRCEVRAAKMAAAMAMACWRVSAVMVFSGEERGVAEEKGV
jgi:hypothetical protein